MAQMLPMIQIIPEMNFALDPATGVIGSSLGGGIVLLSMDEVNEQVAKVELAADELMASLDPYTSPVGSYPGRDGSYVTAGLLTNMVYGFLLASFIIFAAFPILQLMGVLQMADKKAPADGWPVISGDYIVGDPESPVAVTTLASHIEAELSGAAIAGPCKTENLGIEKVVANIISNPNIRFLILAGAEVQGHITGQSIQALYDNGADPDKKKIIGATGAIPFVENVPLDGIERFQQQLEIVDLIDTEDIGAIQSKINECVEKDPGAFEEEAMVISLDDYDSDE